VKHETLLGLLGFMPFSRASSSNPPVIVTELMAGGSLQALITEASKGRAPAKWDDTRKWIAVYGTAVGMKTLHANGIIHRDLKPDNVLLDEDLCPKVGDFGLGKFVSSSAQQQSFLGGTPGFMAPESCLGQCSLASDVFSFGMLVYVTLTNNRPFTDKSPAVIYRKVEQGERPRIPSNISPAFRRLIEDCWDQNPLCRPTFVNIVERLESPDFWASSTDIDTISQYQARVAPERASVLPISARLFGAHREEIKSILDGLLANDLGFLKSVASHLAGKLPCQILFNRLAGVTRTGQVPPDLLLEAAVMMQAAVLAFVLGLFNTYCKVGPDLTAWFRVNYQRGDIVNAFSRFLATARTQQQQALISQITPLFRDSVAILGCQGAWDSLVRRARTILYLPDSELYPAIAPASLQRCLQ
jgi:hypothetical protein